MKSRTIAIAGGGAAGFFAAIAAANANPRAQVVLFEKSPELLSKVTLSGGGRCNVTHHCFDVPRLLLNYPRGARELNGPYRRFQPRDTVEWFESRGVPLKVESDGRMFPVTDSSSSIVNCLRKEAEEAGVRVFTRRGLRAFQPGAQGFALRLTDGTAFEAERLLLATGGNKATAGYSLAASVGHTIEAPVPSLFTFTIEDSTLRDLAGISMPDAQITAPAQRLAQKGPLLITHWGLSGPAALKLSAWGAREFAGCEYTFDILVSWQRGPRDVFAAQLADCRKRHPRRVVVGGGVLEAPARLWEWLCRRAEIPADRQWAQLSKAGENRLLEEIYACRLSVNGKSLYKDEFVTCGGVRLSEVDFRTMESKRCPGLHFAGELLDVDAVTGGFNFQAAWTSGWIAGRAMAGAE
ncbi:MAG: NAD(P)/FAD-dependent oxidoreductase [Kiritimatiellae bacterium]|nr:NAD(P)/FAD-dependent oxidoreductase [Kiritimatiellia bacterium]